MMQALPGPRGTHRAARPPPAASKRRFVRCVETLGLALGLAVPRSALASVQVLPPSRDASLAELIRYGLTPPQARLAKRQLREGHSSFWPNAELVLLAGRAPSHLAEEAAHFLRQAYAPLRLPRSTRDAFYLHTVEEALAYYASKLVCPSRQAGSWRALSDPNAGRQTRHIAALAYAHLAQTRGEAHNLPLVPEHPRVSDAVSHLLGYRLGEALYAARSAGACDFGKLSALFVRPTSGKNEALLLYWQMTLALRHYLKPVRLPAPRRQAGHR